MQLEKLLTKTEVETWWSKKFLIKSEMKTQILMSSWASALDGDEWFQITILNFKF